MTREEAMTVFEAFMDNPLFSEVHKAAFNIAIHDIKQRHEWDINNLILVNKENYEPAKQKPFEKFKSVKDHICKLAGDYKCWDNRLTDDEAIELCHILEQEPVIDKIKPIVEEWKTDTWTDNYSYECMSKIAEIIDKSGSEDEE